MGRGWDAGIPSAAGLHPTEARECSGRVEDGMRTCKHQRCPPSPQNANADLVIKLARCQCAVHLPVVAGKQRVDLEVMAGVSQTSNTCQRRWA